jgi:hypothetical protein
MLSVLKVTMLLYAININEVTIISEISRFTKKTKFSYLNLTLYKHYASIRYKIALKKEFSL